MKKEYVVVRIDASPDGAPYVVISLTSPKDFKEQSQQQLPSPFGSNVAGFTNMDDMVKGLNKMMSGGVFGMPGGVTSLKLEMREYKDLGLSVGDRVVLEMTKPETLGI
ncbi:MAG: hypothetical protein O6761_07660 [Thaumarchaeota archaeon]|nr:hypothetical protein [Nitrososphaerota archaeon]